MADILSQINDAVIGALSSFWGGFVSSMPSLIAAILFILIGYVIGWVAKKVVVRLLKSAHFDDFFLEQKLSASIWNKPLSSVAGSVVKWYVFFVFLKQAVELIKLSTLNEVLGFWINFALLVIAAIVVVIAGLIVGRYIRNAIESSKHSLRKIVGLVVELMIVYIVIVMGIKIIGLPTSLLEAVFLIAFAGFVFALSIALGLGFGLALKDEAKVIVKEIKKQK